MAEGRSATDAATLAAQEEHALNARRNNLAAGMSDTAADFVAMHPVLTSAVEDEGTRVEAVVPARLQDLCRPWARGE